MSVDSFLSASAANDSLIYKMSNQQRGAVQHWPCWGCLVSQRSAFHGGKRVASCTWLSDSRNNPCTSNYLPDNDTIARPHLAARRFGPTDKKNGKSNINQSLVSLASAGSSTGPADDCMSTRVSRAAAVPLLLIV